MEWCITAAVARLRADRAGGVGGALLTQIRRQQPILAHQGIGLRVVGLANSRKMVLNRDGLDLANWQVVV